MFSPASLITLLWKFSCQKLPPAHPQSSQLQNSLGIHPF